MIVPENPPRPPRMDVPPMTAAAMTGADLKAQALGIPGEELDDVNVATEDARALRAAGAAALVEWTPLGLGRDLEGLAAISRASGLHVVACTGLHREAHYPDGFPGSVEELAERFVEE